MESHHAAQGDGGSKKKKNKAITRRLSIGLKKLSLSHSASTSPRSTPHTLSPSSSKAESASGTVSVFADSTSLPAPPPAAPVLSPNRTPKPAALRAHRSARKAPAMQPAPQPGNGRDALAGALRGLRDVAPSMLRVTMTALAVGTCLLLRPAGSSERLTAKPVPKTANPLAGLGWLARLAPWELYSLNSLRRYGLLAPLRKK